MNWNNNNNNKNREARIWQNHASESDFKKKKILRNQQEIEELGQYGRRLCLRFEGIPTEKNETSDKVLEKIMGICNKSGVQIPDTVVDRAKRIGVLDN